MDLGYIGHLQDLVRQAPPTIDEEKGADGEYIRARPVASLRLRREAGFDDADAEFHYIDQLLSHIACIEHARSRPRCGRLERELEVQADLRKEEQQETKKAKRYLHAANVYGEEQTRRLVQQLREDQRLQSELDSLKAKHGFNK